MKKIISLTALAACLAMSAIGAFSSLQSKEEATYAWTGAQTPSVAASYYSSCSGLTGTNLKTALASINKPVSKSYDWSRYEAADEAMDDSSSVISIYTRHNILKTAHVGSSYSWTSWNREHVYTQTAFPNSNTDNHNIFACEGQINNVRNNYKFGAVTHSSTTQVTVFGHLTDCYFSGSYFEPCDDAKGEIARAVLYTSLYYNYAITSIFQSEDLCLKWHAEHPVSQRDIFRNNKVYTLQGNRNPYVDYPSYTNSIYNATVKYTAADPMGGGTGGETTSVTGISLNKSTLKLAVGLSDTLVATVTPNDATNRTVTWSVDDSTVASVSDGLVTALAVGTATITATTVDGSFTATCKLTVPDVNGGGSGGCGGSIAATSGILAAVSLVAVIFIFRKRKLAK